MYTIMNLVSVTQPHQLHQHCQHPHTHTQDTAASGAKPAVPSSFGGAQLSVLNVHGWETGASPLQTQNNALSEPSSLLEDPFPFLFRPTQIAGELKVSSFLLPCLPRRLAHRVAAPVHCLGVCSGDTSRNPRLEVNYRSPM